MHRGPGVTEYRRGELGLLDTEGRGIEKLTFHQVLG